MVYILSLCQHLLENQMGLSQSDEPVRCLLCRVTVVISWEQLPLNAALALFLAPSLPWVFSEIMVSQFRKQKMSQIISFFGKEAFLSVSGSPGLCSGMLSCAGVKCHLFQLLLARGHILQQIQSLAPSLFLYQQGLTRLHFLVGFFSSGFARDSTPGPSGICEVMVTAGGKG